MGCPSESVPFGGAEEAKVLSLHILRGRTIIKGEALTSIVPHIRVVE